MSRLACRYAVVQFLPYAETGEFANVGVVLLCPEARYFGYRLQTRRFKRVTAFFEHVGRTTYGRALKLLADELNRVEQWLVAEAFAKDDQEAARHAFAMLLHPREAVVRFGEPRVILTETPDQALEQLFGRYVEHDFVTREYREIQLEKRIGALLRTLPLTRPFRAATLGNDEIHARFLFVQMEGDAARKLIKPFFLGQDEPNKIYDHADPWLQKIRRMRARKLLPERMLFTVEAPPEEDEKRYHAYREIHDELAALGLLTVPARDEHGIAEFARA